MNPPDSRTPLGGQMSPGYVAARAGGPLVWHLAYWLNIGVVGTLRGQDWTLTVIRIEREQSLCPDLELREQIRTHWIPFQRDHLNDYYQNWQHMGIYGVDGQLFLSDLDTMLMDKETKTREYLQVMEARMVDMLRNSQVVQARMIFDKLGDVYEKLRRETITEAETRANEARHRFPNDQNGVHLHGGQSPQANAENGVSDHGGESPQAPTMNGFAGHGGEGTQSPTMNGFAGHGGEGTQSPTMNGFAGHGGEGSQTPTMNGFVGHGREGSQAPTMNGFGGSEHTSEEDE